jgi:hypothetical protein
MMTLMQEGGVPMWFILAFGLAALTSAVRYALRPEARVRGLMMGMSLATLFASLAALAAAQGRLEAQLSELNTALVEPRFGLIAFALQADVSRVQRGHELLREAGLIQKRAP